MRRMWRYVLLLLLAAAPASRAGASVPMTDMSGTGLPVGLVFADEDTQQRRDVLAFTGLVITEEAEVLDHAARSVALCVTPRRGDHRLEGQRKRVLPHNPACRSRTTRRVARRLALGDAAQGGGENLDLTGGFDTGFERLGRWWGALPRPALGDDEPTATDDESGAQAEARRLTRLTLPEETLVTAAMPSLRPAPPPPALAAPTSTPVPPAAALFMPFALLMWRRRAARR